MEDITRYYLIDWFAMALSLIGVYLLGNKKKIGFVIFAISNLLWTLLGFTLMGSTGVAVGNIIFFIINTRGFIKWQHQNDTKESV